MDSPYDRGRQGAQTSRDGSPARIVAPDPRWFALQKLWMGAQEKRNPLKRTKDAIQGRALLDAIKSNMRQFPLDGAFEDSLPTELLPFYREWKEEVGDGGYPTPPWNNH